MRKRSRWTALIALGVLVTAAAGLGRALAPAAHAQEPAARVYWDQNEEEDFLPSSTAPFTGQQLVPPWDPNGQMCVFPDGTGRFAVAYNPTGVEQKSNTGTQDAGALLPRKQPPVGIAVYNPDGSFTGQDLYVPGPYKLTPASSQWTSHGVVGPDAGGDIPPDPNNGPFNSKGTYTGCAFDRRGNFFAVDLGTSQGQYPPGDDGRLIEWFAPDFKKQCTIYGPTGGGDAGSHHHVDGHGGLQQPGTMAHDDAGNVYVPVDASDPNTMLPQGKVLKFAESELPATPSQCPYDTGTGAGPGDQTSYHVTNPTTFIDTTAAGMPFPFGIARDPVCKCWAVSNVFFGPFAVQWFHDDGTPAPELHLPIAANPPTPLPLPAEVGTVQSFNPQFTPGGLAFDPQGNLFAADLHIQFDVVGSITGGGISAGPQDRAGQIVKFTFTRPPAGPALASAPTVVMGGISFPVSVTVCDPAQQVCPAPGAAPARASAPASPQGANVQGRRSTGTRGLAATGAPSAGREGLLLLLLAVVLALRRRSPTRR